jgi:hypothetical protein
MKPTIVSYQKTFPLAAYSNEKIGVEISIDDTDNPEIALAEAKRIVEKFHKDNNLGLYIETDLSFFGIEQPKYNHMGSDKVITSEEKKIGVKEEDILSCTELKTLESYKLIVKKDPKLQAAYNLKHTELSNQ